jgi:hypothetical protein
MLMLKRLRPDQRKQDLRSLTNSRNAVQFLYEESLANGNADITALLGEALTCGDELIAEKQEISYKSKEALLYWFFLRAIVGLHPEKIGHLVELLEWLTIIPPDRETGQTGDVRKRRKVD